MEREGKKMKSALAKKLGIQPIDYKKLLSSYELPKGKNGFIILNPKNEVHRAILDS